MTVNLQEAWTDFVNERTPTLCPTTLTADYAQVRKWIDRCPITDLSQGRQVLAWVLTQQPVKTSRRVAMYVKSLYRWAASEDIGYIDRNPVTSYRMPKPPQGEEEVVVIPRNEMGILLTALEARQMRNGSNWASYAEFMLQTAMRTGEVRAMKWTDIKDQKVLIHSNFTLTHGLKDSTKTNKKRSVPLNERCQEILDETAQVSEYVFPYNRYAFQSFFYDRARELHAAELTSHRYRPYDLRHTAISRWVEAGIPVAQAAKWAGNSSEMIWKYYVNVTKEYEMPVL
jgi:integrase